MSSFLHRVPSGPADSSTSSSVFGPSAPDLPAAAGFSSASLSLVAAPPSAVLPSSSPSSVSRPGGLYPVDTARMRRQLARDLHLRSALSALLNRLSLFCSTIAEPDSEAWLYLSANLGRLSALNQLPSDRILSKAEIHAALVEAGIEPNPGYRPEEWAAMANNAGRGDDPLIRSIAAEPSPVPMHENAALSSLSGLNNLYPPAGGQWSADPIAQILGDRPQAPGMRAILGVLRDPAVLEAASKFTGLPLSSLASSSSSTTGDLLSRAGELAKNILPPAFGSPGPVDTRLDPSGTVLPPGRTIPGAFASLFKAMIAPKSLTPEERAELVNLNPLNYSLYPKILENGLFFGPGLAAGRDSSMVSVEEIKRLRGVDGVDEAARIHDIAYKEAKSVDDLRVADRAAQASMWRAALSPGDISVKSRLLGVLGGGALALQSVAPGWMRMSGGLPQHPGGQAPKDGFISRGLKSLGLLHDERDVAAGAIAPGRDIGPRAAALRAAAGLENPRGWEAGAAAVAAAHALPPPDPDGADVRAAVRSASAQALAPEEWKRNPEEAALWSVAHSAVGDRATLASRVATAWMPTAAKSVVPAVARALGPPARRGVPSPDKQAARTRFLEQNLRQMEAATATVNPLVRQTAHSAGVVGALLSRSSLLQPPPRIGDPPNSPSSDVLLATALGTAPRDVQAEHVDGVMQRRQADWNNRIQSAPPSEEAADGPGERAITRALADAQGMSVAGAEARLAAVAAASTTAPQLPSASPDRPGIPVDQAATIMNKARAFWRGAWIRLFLFASGSASGNRCRLPGFPKNQTEWQTGPSLQSILGKAFPTVGIEPRDSGLETMRARGTFTVADGIADQMMIRQGVIGLPFYPGGLAAAPSPRWLGCPVLLGALRSATNAAVGLPAVCVRNVHLQHHTVATVGTNRFGYPLTLSSITAQFLAPIAPKDQAAAATMTTSELTTGLQLSDLYILSGVAEEQSVAQSRLQLGSIGLNYGLAWLLACLLGPVSENPWLETLSVWAPGYTLQPGDIRSPVMLINPVNVGGGPPESARGAGLRPMFPWSQAVSGTLVAVLSVSSVPAGVPYLMIPAWLAVLDGQIPGVMASYISLFAPQPWCYPALSLNAMRTPNTTARTQAAWDGAAFNQADAVDLVPYTYRVRVPGYSTLYVVFPRSTRDRTLPLTVAAAQASLITPFTTGASPTVMEVGGAGAVNQPAFTLLPVYPPGTVQQSTDFAGYLVSWAGSIFSTPVLSALRLALVKVIPAVIFSWGLIRAGLESWMMSPRYVTDLTFAAQFRAVRRTSPATEYSTEIINFAALMEEWTGFPPHLPTTATNLIATSAVPGIRSYILAPDLAVVNSVIIGLLECPSGGRVSADQFDSDRSVRSTVGWVLRAACCASIANEILPDARTLTNPTATENIVTGAAGVALAVATPFSALVRSIPGTFDLRRGMTPGGYSDLLSRAYAGLFETGLPGDDALPPLFGPFSPPVRDAALVGGVAYTPRLQSGALYVASGGAGETWPDAPDTTAGQFNYSYGLMGTIGDLNFAFTVKNLPGRRKLPWPTDVLTQFDLSSPKWGTPTKLTPAGSLVGAGVSFIILPHPASLPLDVLIDPSSGAVPSWVTAWEFRSFARRCLIYGSTGIAGGHPNGVLTHRFVDGTQPAGPFTTFPLTPSIAIGSIPRNLSLIINGVNGAQVGQFIPDFFTNDIPYYLVNECPTGIGVPPVLYPTVPFSEGMLCHETGALAPWTVVPPQGAAVLASVFGSAGVSSGVSPLDFLYSVPPAMPAGPSSSSSTPSGPLDAGKKG